MKRIKVGLILLSVGMIISWGTNTAFGKIIPLAQQAKDHVAAPENSPVITIVDGDWELTPSSNENKPSVPVAFGKIIPLAQQAKDHAVAPENSPVITIVDGDWELTPSSNENDSVLTSLLVGSELPQVNATVLMHEPLTVPVSGVAEFSSFALTPEPATVLLFGLGAVMLRRKQCPVNHRQRIS